MGFFVGLVIGGGGGGGGGGSGAGSVFFGGKIHAEGNLCYKLKLFTFKIYVCSDH